MGPHSSEAWRPLAGGKLTGHLHTKHEKVFFFHSSSIFLEMYDPFDSLSLPSFARDTGMRNLSQLGKSQQPEIDERARPSAGGGDREG